MENTTKSSGLYMKITIGTAYSNMEFGEDIKLIKSSLLYADEIELIGMAEYAIFCYLSRYLSGSKELDLMIKRLIPFLASFENPEMQSLANQLRELQGKSEPYVPLLRKKKNRGKQEILAQLQMRQVTSQCNDLLEEAMAAMLNQKGTRAIQELIDRKIVSVYDYSHNGFSVDELTGGYFANLIGIIKHGGSYPLFDNVSSDLVKTVVNTKIFDFGKTDKEIMRHAGIANHILMTLPTLEGASVDEILDFKKDLRIPLANFRTAIYQFSEQVAFMPWDDNFQYECLKLYDTEVVPRVHEINELSSETSVLKNFGRKVLVDEEERKKLGFVGAGLATTITTGADMVDALGVIENIIRSGTKIGLTAAGVAAFLKTADLLRQSHDEVKEVKARIEGNVMYYYYKAFHKI